MPRLAEIHKGLKAVKKQLNGNSLPIKISKVSEKELLRNIQQFMIELDANNDFEKSTEQTQLLMKWILEISEKVNEIAELSQLHTGWLIEHAEALDELKTQLEAVKGSIVNVGKQVEAIPQPKSRTMPKSFDVQRDDEGLIQRVVIK